MSKIKVFDGYQEIFKVRINYKSGNFIEDWFSEFSFYSDKISWTCCFSPKQISDLCTLLTHNHGVVQRNIQDFEFNTETTLNEILFIYTKFLAPSNIIFMGVDDIENVIQIESNIINKPSEEFVTFIQSKVKEEIGEE